MRNYLLLIIPLLFFSCDTEPVAEDSSKVKSLPYYGIHDLPKQDSGGDTLFYSIPKFSFINQNGKEISHLDYEGTVFVSDFFFTTCPTICPIMSSQMARLQELVKQKGLKEDVMFLSHSVNPEHDRPDTLKHYAENIGADTTNWNFVTGERSDIYWQAKDGYFVNALASDTAQGGFIHSDNFVLIDREMHIRGYYDGTSTKEVDSLLLDIETLLKSYNERTE